MINVDGRRVDYTESGDGPAVLFIPGSFSTPAAWTNIQKLLPQEYRCVGTSLCGYGSTEGVAAEFEAVFNEGERDAPSRIIDFWVVVVLLMLCQIACKNIVVRRASQTFSIGIRHSILMQK